SLGESTEQVAARYGVDRAQQDAFALRSHERAARAWAEGTFAAEITQVPGAELDRDESIRETSAEKLASLKPAFRPDGTITAGNATRLSDGAARLLIGEAAAVVCVGREPLARSVSRAGAAVDPDIL